MRNLGKFASFLEEENKMKKALLVALTIGLIATSAQAAVLGYDPALAGVNQVVSGQQVALPIVLEVKATDKLQGLFAGNAAVGDAIGMQDSVTFDDPNLPSNWYAKNDASVNRQLGVDGQQVVVGIEGGSGYLPAPGSYVVAIQTVTFTGDIGDTLEITFRHDAINVITSSGGDAAFGPAFAEAFPNAWTYGLGAPDAGNDDIGRTAYNPVQFEIVPEPASLSLLALGGLVALRRRR
jgi:hypothetical protein